MFKIYKSNGHGTTISIRKGLFRSLWYAYQLRCQGYATKIVKY